MKYGLKKLAKKAKKLSLKKSKSEKKSKKKSKKGLTALEDEDHSFSSRSSSDESESSSSSVSVSSSSSTASNNKESDGTWLQQHNSAAATAVTTNTRRNRMMEQRRLRSVSTAQPGRGVRERARRRSSLSGMTMSTESELEYGQEEANIDNATGNESAFPPQRQFRVQRRNSLTGMSPNHTSRGITPTNDEDSNNNNNGNTAREEALALRATMMQQARKHASAREKSVPTPAANNGNSDGPTAAAAAAAAGGGAGARRVTPRRTKSTSDFSEPQKKEEVASTSTPATATTNSSTTSGTTSTRERRAPPRRTKSTNELPMPQSKEGTAATASSTPGIRRVPRRTKSSLANAAVAVMKEGAPDSAVSTNAATRRKRRPVNREIPARGVATDGDNDDKPKAPQASERALSTARKGRQMKRRGSIGCDGRDDLGIDNGAGGGEGQRQQQQKKDHRKEEKAKKEAMVAAWKQKRKELQRESDHYRQMQNQQSYSSSSDEDSFADVVEDDGQVGTSMDCFQTPVRGSARAKAKATPDSIDVIFIADGDEEQNDITSDFLKTPVRGSSGRAKVISSSDDNDDNQQMEIMSDHLKTPVRGSSARVRDVLMNDDDEEEEENNEQAEMALFSLETCVQESSGRGKSMTGLIVNEDMPIRDGGEHRSKSPAGAAAERDCDSGDDVLSEEESEHSKRPKTTALNDEDARSSRNSSDDKEKGKNGIDTGDRSGNCIEQNSSFPAASADGTLFKTPKATSKSMGFTCTSSREDENVDGFAPLTVRPPLGDALSAMKKRNNNNEYDGDNAENDDFRSVGPSMWSIPSSRYAVKQHVPKQKVMVDPSNIAGLPSLWEENNQSILEGKDTGAAKAELSAEIADGYNEDFFEHSDSDEHVTSGCPSHIKEKDCLRLDGSDQSLERNGPDGIDKNQKETCEMQQEDGMDAVQALQGSANDRSQEMCDGIDSLESVSDRDEDDSSASKCDDEDAPVRALPMPRRTTHKPDPVEYDAGQLGYEDIGLDKEPLKALTALEQSLEHQDTSDSFIPDSSGSNDGDSEEYQDSSDRVHTVTAPRKEHKNVPIRKKVLSEKASWRQHHSIQDCGSTENICESNVLNKAQQQARGRSGAVTRDLIKNKPTDGASLKPSTPFQRIFGVPGQDRPINFAATTVPETER